MNWCGEGSFVSRRRVNSDVAPVRTGSGSDRIKSSSQHVRSVPSAWADGLKIQPLSPA